MVGQARRRTVAAFAAGVVLSLLLAPAGARAAVVTDSFSGTDGTLLQAHVGETGASWSQNPAFPQFSGQAHLSGNRVYAAAGSLYTASGVPPSADYDVWADLYVKSNVGSTGIVARADGDPANSGDTDAEYVARYDQPTGSWQLLRCMGVCELLGSYAQALTVGQTYTLHLALRGTALKLYVDSVLRVSVPDDWNPIARAGRAGIGQWGADATPTTGYHLDNFTVDAPATVLWAGNAEQPAEQEWASWCINNGDGTLANPGNGVLIPTGATSDRIQRSTFAVQGTYSYRFQVQQDDHCGSPSKAAVRSELGQDNPSRSTMLNRIFYENDDRWIAWQVYLPTDFPSDTSLWQEIAQWHQFAGGGPPLEMGVTQGKFHLIRSTTTYYSDVDTEDVTPTASWPVVKGRWVKFTMHVKFSPNPAVGFVELYGDLATPGQIRQLLPKTPTWTMKKDANGNALRTHARIGIYRNASIPSPSTLYYDGYTVATTRAAAEQAAFTLP
jgi:hypothetical protein